ncbi:hypothetical protein MMPV_001308 [Pyropia vietnamensis]
MAYGQHGTGVGASTTWGELLRLERGVSQREFSLPAHAAARARLYEELTLHGRARLAACQGGGAGRWLAALPLPGPGGAAFSGDAMRVAVRLWLGVAPRSAPPGHRCRCGAEVDAEGRHFLGPCLALKRRATHLHTTIVKQVEGALGESAVWRDVVVEPELYPGAPESLRPDLRATRVTSGRRTWADVSLASPLEARELARVAAAPLAPLAAAKRERGKAAKYEAALPAATPPSEFAPLVWETFGRVGPATAAFLRSALGGPGGTSARSALLRGVSVAIWRSHAWAVATGYANSGAPAALAVGGRPAEPAPPTPAAAARPAVAVAAAGASAAPVDGAPLPSPRGALPPLPCAAPLAAAMAPVGPAAADAGTSPVTAMDGVVPASAAAAPPSSVAARAAPGGAPAVSSPAGLTPPAALPSDPAQGGAPTAHQRPPRGAPTPLPRRSVAPPPAAVREVCGGRAAAAGGAVAEPAATSGAAFGPRADTASASPTLAPPAAATAAAAAPARPATPVATVAAAPPPKRADPVPACLAAATAAAARVPVGFGPEAPPRFAPRVPLLGETPVPSGGPAFPAAAAVAAPATGAPLPATGAAAQGLTPCPAAGCADQVQGGPEGDALALHLRRHAMREVPATVAARLNLVACPHCDRPFRGRTGARGRSSHSSHVSQCAQNPRRRLVRPAAAPAVPAAAPAAAGAAQERGGSGCGGGREDLFGSDFAAWRRRREDFLRVAAPDADAWPALVAAGARTMDCVPAALLPAWRRLMAEALDWARTEPEREHAWLWLLLLPSLLLHQPSASSLPARRGARDTHAARAVAVLAGEFGAALAARDAGIWRPLSDPGPPQRIPSTPGWGGVGAPAPLPAAPWLAGGPSPPPCATSAQRRALRQARHGRLSAAARTLLSEPPAPRTPAVWAKAQQLFPPSSPDLATAASVEAAFPDELAALAAAAGQLAVPRTVSRDTVTLAIRAAPRGEALVGVVLLLTGEAAVTRVPSVARTALAGADLLLLRKPGGLAADGLPKLRPIGMPEALRKLAASALARTVRDAAAALLGPHQQGVGVRSACERVLHELRAQLAACPTQAAVQLDFSNAFNRVSRTAARVVGERTLPLLTPYFDWVYGGEGPPVYGWAEEADAGPPPTTPNPTLPLRGRPHVPVSAPVSAVQRPAPRRLSLRAERGAQQGDPLGPLLHALALQLPLLRLARGCPRLLIRAFHDDVVAVGPPADLARFVGAAGVAGSAIDAALAPANAPPRALQSQLHLLRLCAGPRANFWLRALPLVWGARLAGAVDRDARSALTALLCDAADPPARRAALLERAALPVAMGGLGIGGRVRVAPAAALASWLDALRAGRAYSPALRAVAAALSERPVVAADGGPVAPPPPPTSLPSAARADPAAVPSSAAAGLAAPPLTAEEVAAGLRAARAAAPGGESGLVWDSGGESSEGDGTPNLPPDPPSRTSAGPELVAGPEPLAAQMCLRL